MGQSSQNIFKMYTLKTTLECYITLPMFKFKIFSKVPKYFFWGTGFWKKYFPLILRVQYSGVSD